MNISGHKYYKVITIVLGMMPTIFIELEGAHLATITSQEENDFIAGYAGSSVWIGLNDYEESRVWRWVTGEDVILY